MLKALTMALIEEAISKNVCKPTKKEELEFSIDRRFRASPSAEGDSQMGIILFCGIAKDSGFTKDDILLFASIQPSVYSFKIEKYNRLLRQSKRFVNKVKLIKTYINYARKQ